MLPNRRGTRSLDRPVRRKSRLTAIRAQCSRLCWRYVELHRILRRKRSGRDQQHHGPTAKHQPQKILSRNFHDVPSVASGASKARPDRATEWRAEAYQEMNCHARKALVRPWRWPRPDESGHRYLSGDRPRYFRSSREIHRQSQDRIGGRTSERFPRERLNRAVWPGMDDRK